MFSNKEQKSNLSFKVLNPIIPSLRSCVIETFKKVNMDLAGELQELEAAFNDQKKIDELNSKLSKLNIRNGIINGREKTIR